MGNAHCHSIDIQWITYLLRTCARLWEIHELYRHFPIVSQWDHDPRWFSIAMATKVSSDIPSMAPEDNTDSTVTNPSQPSHSPTPEKEAPDAQDPLRSKGKSITQTSDPPQNPKEVLQTSLSVRSVTQGEKRPVRRKSVSRESQTRPRKSTLMMAKIFP